MFFFSCLAGKIFTLLRKLIWNFGYDGTNWRENINHPLRFREKRLLCNQTTGTGRRYLMFKPLIWKYELNCFKQS